MKRVSDIELTDTDVEALTVSYTYTYQLDQGRPTTEDVTLQLELQDDGTYLISGAS